VRRGVLITLTAVILLFSSFTFSSCKSCDKEDKGREPIGGDGNANNKPLDTSTSNKACNKDKGKEPIGRNGNANDKPSDKACNKNKGKEPVGGDDNANDKPSDTSTTGDNGSDSGATEGVSPALSAREKKEDIVRKRTAALNSIDAAGDLANETRAICDIDTDPNRDWINDIDNTICGNNVTSWLIVIEAITHAYVYSNDGSTYDGLSSSEKGNVKQELKSNQEKSKDLYKTSDAHIEKIRDGTLPPPESSLQVITDGRDENGRSIWRDETPTEMAARREKFLKSWDALIEAVDKAYTDTKAVFDAVDAQSDGWTLIDILHD
jgi:hypothetical protein